MKKLAFLFAAAVAVSFASCSQKAEQSNTEEQQGEAPVVEQPCEKQEEAACKCDTCTCEPCECAKACEEQACTGECEGAEEVESTEAPAGE